MTGLQGGTEHCCRRRPDGSGLVSVRQDDLSPNMETDMTTTIDAPSPDTKEAALVKALKGRGKNITQLSELLAWQPHTVRAAFTRLRKRGYLIERVPATEKTPARFRLKTATKRDKA